MANWIQSFNKILLPTHNANISMKLKCDSTAYCARNTQTAKPIKELIDDGFRFVSIPRVEYLCSPDNVGCEWFRPEIWTICEIEMILTFRNKGKLLLSSPLSRCIILNKPTTKSCSIALRPQPNPHKFNLSLDLCNSRIWNKLQCFSCLIPHSQLNYLVEPPLRARKGLMPARPQDLQEPQIQLQSKLNQKRKNH